MKQERRQNDWSQERGRASSPKGASSRIREGGSREGSLKQARDAESSWRTGANAFPLAPVNRGDSSRSSGWGGSSRGGRIESTSIPSGWSEAASRPASGGVESLGSGRSESMIGRGKHSASNDGWGTTPPPPSHPPPRLPPPPPPPPLSPPIPPRLPATEVFHSLTPGLTKAEEAARSLKESDQKKISKEDVRTSRKRKHYWNRLTLLADAILLRNEYTQVTRTLEARRKMQNTIRYTHVSENVQSKLNGFAQEYEDKGKELKAKVDSILAKLVDGDILANGTPDEEALAMDQASLRHLQTRFGQLEGMLHKLTLEASHWNSQPRKQPDGNPSAGQKRPHEPDEGTESDHGILKRLERLEVLLSDIDNQSTQQAENVIQLVDARLDLKMSKLQPGGYIPELGELVDTTTEGPHSEPGMSQIGDSLREQVAKLTSDHDEFVEETANLITKHAETSADIHRLQEENTALKQALLGCQSSLRSAQDMADRNERQVQALVEAVKVIREQSSQPPPQMDIHAMDQLRRRILQEVLSSVNVSLLAFREQSEEAWRSSREETLNQITAKFTPTMDLVNIIHEYFSENREMEERLPST